MFPYYKSIAEAHGGHGYQHHKEMEKIAWEVAREELRRALPEIRQYIMDRLPDNSEIQKQAYEQGFRDAYAKFKEDLSFDVNTMVNVAFDNGESIFSDKKTQKVIADKVMAEVEKQIKHMK